jgi:hypothetical protein
MKILFCLVTHAEENGEKRENKYAWAKYNIYSNNK